MASRTIVFGDIHGCHAEWQDLLDGLAVTSSDRLIAVGDLVCKGPSTRRTLDLAMSLSNLTCVVGNNELRFLACWKAGRKPDLKAVDREAVAEMGERFEAQMRYIASWPMYLDLPELTVVHAGMRPGVPLERQTEFDLVNLRQIQGRPWYEYYQGPKPVAFGHWVRKQALVTERVIGLDTGVVYGNRLSAWVLPDKKVVSVPARRAYTQKKREWA